MSKTTKQLDVTGMLCPSPLIHLRTAIESINTDDLLEVRGDDPIFKETVLDFCEENGYEVLQVETHGRLVTVKLRKSGG